MVIGSAKKLKPLTRHVRLFQKVRPMTGEPRSDASREKGRERLRAREAYTVICAYITPNVESAKGEPARIVQLCLCLLQCFILSNWAVFSPGKSRPKSAISKTRPIFENDSGIFK